MLYSLNKVERQFLNQLYSAELTEENAEKVVRFLSKRISSDKILFLGRSDGQWYIDGLILFGTIFAVSSAFLVPLAGSFVFITGVTALYFNRIGFFFRFLIKPNKFIQLWLKSERKKLEAEKIQQFEQELTRNDTIYTFNKSGGLVKSKKGNSASSSFDDIDSLIDSKLKKSASSSFDDIDSLIDSKLKKMEQKLSDFGSSRLERFDKMFDDADFKKQQIRPFPNPQKKFWNKNKN